MNAFCSLRLYRNMPILLQIFSINGAFSGMCVSRTETEVLQPPNAYHRGGFNKMTNHLAQSFSFVKSTQVHYEMINFILRCVHHIVSHFLKWN